MTQERSEFELWLDSVTRNADAIEGLQDALMKSPEFNVLMQTYRSVPRERMEEAKRVVSDFVVLWMTKNVKNFQG